MAQARERKLTGDPNEEHARGERGRGTRTPSGTTRTNAATLAREGDARGEANASAEQAKTTFAKVCGLVAEQERKGAQGAYSRLIEAGMAWLPFKPTLSAMAEVMDSHGLVNRRRSRVKASGGTRVKDGNPDRSVAVQTMFLCRLMRPDLMAESETKVRLVAAMKGGVTMPDGGKYTTPLEALKSGKYSKSAVYNEWRFAVAPPRDISDRPTTVEGAVTQKGLSIRIPLQVRKGSTVEPVDAAADRKASLMVVTALLRKWGSVEAFTDAEREAIDKALDTTPPVVSTGDVTPPVTPADETKAA